MIVIDDVTTEGQMAAIWDRYAVHPTKMICTHRARVFTAYGKTMRVDFVGPRRWLDAYEAKAIARGWRQ